MFNYPEFTLNNTLFLLIGLLGLIPSIILLDYYWRTRIIDFLLVGFAFFVTSLQAFFLIFLSANPNSLIIQQIDDFLYPTMISLFLFHGLRLNWDKIPLKILVPSITWYSILLISILFYEWQEIPDEGTVIIFHMKNLGDLEYGQILIINDRIIIGQGYEFFAQAYRIYAFSLIFYSYKRAKIFANEVGSLKTRRILLYGIILILVFPLVAIGQMFQLYDPEPYNQLILHFLDLGAMVIVAYIAIFKPETLLLSKVQILRAGDLWKNLDKSLVGDQPRYEQIHQYMSKVLLMYPELVKRD